MKVKVKVKNRHTQQVGWVAYDDLHNDVYLLPHKDLADVMTCNVEQLVQKSYDSYEHLNIFEVLEVVNETTQSQKP